MSLSLTQIENALSNYAYRSRGDENQGKWAGVAAIISTLDSNELGVLLIQRSENPNDPWSGHMAMPGGRMEDFETSSRTTAERETLEEIGVNLKGNARYLGRLDDVTAVSRAKSTGLIIAVHVYYMEKLEDIVINEEVQSTVWVPMHELQGSDYRSTLPYTVGETQLLLPCWRWEGRVIWGLTYGMIDNLLRIVE